MLQASERVNLLNGLFVVVSQMWHHMESSGALSPPFINCWSPAYAALIACKYIQKRTCQALANDTAACGAKVNRSGEAAEKSRFASGLARLIPEQPRRDLELLLAARERCPWPLWHHRGLKQTHQVEPVKDVEDQKHSNDVVWKYNKAKFVWCFY